MKFFFLVYNGDPFQMNLKKIYLEPENPSPLESNPHFSTQEYQNILQNMLMQDQDENELFTVSSISNANV